MAMLRLTIGMLALLLGVWAFVPMRGTVSTRLPPGFTKEECHYEDKSPGPVELTTCSDRDFERVGFVWSHVDGAASYRVSGEILYWPLPCTGPGPASTTRRPLDSEFSEVLSARVLWFGMPKPQEPGPYLLKEYHFSVEALDNGGEVLAQNGRGLIAEVPWGLNNPKWQRPFCLATGLLLRRSA